MAAARSIEEIWQERRELFDAYCADDSTFDDPAKDQSYWDRIDQTEVAILSHPDTSVRAAEIRLWIAWWHCNPTRIDAVAVGHVEAHRRHHEKLDWHEKLIFAAILNIRGESL